MERTNITRGVAVDEVPATSTRLVIMVDDHLDTPTQQELDVEAVRALVWTLAQWLLENDDELTTPWLMVTEPNTTTSTVVRKDGRHVVTVTP